MRARNSEGVTHRIAKHRAGATSASPRRRRLRTRVRAENLPSARKCRDPGLLRARGSPGAPPRPEKRVPIRIGAPLMGA